VDESAASDADALAGAAARALEGRWLGTVVPKRHAKRAVTRNLLKRQMRAVVQHEADRLPPGLWVLRLKAPFDKQQFPSAASPPLRVLARGELATLLQRAVSRAAR
jgi:ribonuclease P protein component